MRKYQLHTNELLLELVSSNDEAAFTELYNRYWQKLFALAYSRVKESATAEDIVHDVFASLWANRQKVAINALENYLATATKYLVLDKIKKKERERRFKLQQTDVQNLDMRIESSLHYKRILELVDREVNNLPEKCRLVFKYSRQQSMPVKQIAQKMNISPRTVENQLAKAMRQLKLASKGFLSLF